MICLFGFVCVWVLYVVKELEYCMSWKLKLKVVKSIRYFVTLKILAKIKCHSTQLLTKLYTYCERLIFCGFPHECYIVTMHCQNVGVVFNFTETVHSRNKSHAKFKAITVC